MKKAELKRYLKSDDAKREAERLEPSLRKAAPLLEGRVLVMMVSLKGQAGLRHIGSCVLVNVHGRIFLLTAAHVLDEIIKQPPGDAELYLYGGGIFRIAGTAFLRADDFQIDKKPVVVDTAVIELAEPVPDALRVRSIDARALSPPNHQDVHLMAGYPHAQTVQKGNLTLYGLTIIPTVLYGVRRINGQNIAFSIGGTIVNDASCAFTYYGVNHKNGQINQAKSLHGISGGAIFCMKGQPTDIEEPIADEIGLTLAAIIVEKVERTNDDPPVIIGTNVLVHLAMIDELVHRADRARYEWQATDTSLAGPMPAQTQ